MSKEKKIEEALESIRPFLKKDGGDVEFVELTDDNIVKVKLIGACESCNMSGITLKAGIEEAVIAAVPEITEVQAV